VARRLKPADQATWLKHAHLVLSIVWLAMVPIALVTGWISSLIFISACSIYANAASHLSAWQASRAETNGDNSQVTAYDDRIDIDSPVSHWKLGEASGTNAVDRKGVNAGTYGGTAGNRTMGVATLLPSGDAGNTAVSFTFAAAGTSGRVDINTLTGLNIPSAFTLECWIKPTVTTGSIAPRASQNVVSYQDVGILISSAGKVGFWDLSVTMASVQTLVAGNTYYVACTYDGTTRRLYINGLLDNSDLRPPAAAFTALTFANYTSHNGDDYGGVIDEVAIYNKELSPTAVSEHYAFGQTSRTRRRGLR
jgi:hypothetical protein